MHATTDPPRVTMDAATAMTRAAQATTHAAAVITGAAQPVGAPESGPAVAARSEPPTAAPADPPTAVPASIGQRATPGAVRHQIAGTRHVWQKWNNCGPSALVMALSAFGLDLDQLAVAARLKPDPEDTNITPAELARFAREQGLGARAMIGGDARLARELVRVGVPIAAEQWIDVEGRGEMGHYRVVVGFDDEAGELTAQDSYYGPLRRYSYADFDRMWRPFLGAYAVFYRPEHEPVVAEVLAGDWDEGEMTRRALAAAESWAVEDPADARLWFALGEARSRTGDHHGAIEAFETARRIGLPFRSYWYQFGHYESLIAVGAAERALAIADETIATMGGENLEESHYWRGVALEQLGRHDEAQQSFRTALAYNPSFAPAAEELDSP